MSQIDIKTPTITKARADSRAGVPRYEVADSRAKGLRLRVGPTAIVWQYRFMMLKQSSTLTLGSIDVWSIDEARRLVSDAQVLIKGKLRRPDDAWVGEQLVAHGKVAAPVVEAAVPPAKPESEWTWEYARDLYLADVERKNKAKTFRDYRNRLTNPPELARFIGRRVGSVTLSEASRAIADIHARGVESQAEHVAANISAFYTWLAKPVRRDLTGVERGRMADLEAPARTLLTKATIKKRYAPPMHEVGRIMSIARSGALEEQIGLAIQMLCYTVQRVTFVVHAEIDAMTYAAAKIEGTWTMDPFNRKTALRRDDTTNHVVPLPPPAWRVIERAIELAGDRATYLFPGMHPGKGGIMPATMSESAVQHNLSYFPGVIGTPHDLRRSFSHFGQAQFRWGKEGSQLILDHNEGHSSHDVTVRSYLHDGTGEKWDIMRQWCGWVDEAAGEALEFDRRLEDVEWLRAHIIRARTEIKDRKRQEKGLPPKRLGVSLVKPLAA